MDRYAVTVGRLPVVPRSVDPTPTVSSTPVVRSRGSRAAHRLGRVTLNLVFAAMIACVAVMLIPPLLGFQRYIIMTGSMTGTYNRGSIVYDRAVPTSQLKVGDPITYSPPPGYTSQARVSHRIYSIHRGPDGERVFKTKGDANQHPDVWSFTLNKPTQDKVIFHIPEIGYLFLLLSLRNFRIVLVGVPCVIIGLVLVSRLWREGGEVARAQKLAERGWHALREFQSIAVLAPLQTPLPEPRPARLDLRLRPVHRGPVGIGSNVARHHRFDVSQPLRVPRLWPEAGRIVNDDANPAGRSGGVGVSLATLRLRVASLR
jgi:signal peptidase